MSIQMIVVSPPGYFGSFCKELELTMKVTAFYRGLPDAGRNWRFTAKLQK